MRNPDIIRVPGTNYWVLKNDANLTPKALIAGTIKLELGILQLPEMQALKSGDTVIDVGAFIGDTALHLCEIGCDVIAYEPQPDAFECLQRNCPEALCINAAAGRGEPLVFADGADAGNLGTRRVVDAASGKTAALIDHVTGSRDVKLLKLDCEGSEVDALLGATEMIARCKPVIICEVYGSMLLHRGRTKAELLDLIESFGYVWRVAIGRIEDDRFDIVATPKCATASS